MPIGDALDKALTTNVLTHDGVPFHAILTFKPKEPDVDQKISGTVQVFWSAPKHYRLQLETPAFGQTLIVDGDRIQETDRGDFYPNWLQNFVTGLLDPMSRLASIREHPNRITGGPAGNGYFMQPCVGRDDRPNNVTDQLTWAQICFDTNGPQLQFVIDFAYNMQFGDFHDFHGKQIAHTYTSGTGSNDPLIGRLTALEDWHPDDKLLTVITPTPLTDRILTTLVSTQQEESMVESAPKDVQWPHVPEGPFHGFMIVQAIADRTGQVRWSSKHNSDNGLLEAFGRDVAMRYKFHPLVVDGVPQQMIMPLVLHFHTAMDHPLPDLDDKQTRHIITGCDLPHKIGDPASAGQMIEIVFKVHDDGKMETVGSSDRKIPVLNLFRQFQSCRFGTVKQDGKPTAYYAHLAVAAQ
jgi:hypothetical protein